MLSTLLSLHFLGCYDNGLDNKIFCEASIRASSSLLQQLPFHAVFKNMLPIVASQTSTAAWLAYVFASQVN